MYLFQDKAHGRKWNAEEIRKDAQDIWRLRRDEATTTECT